MNPDTLLTALIALSAMVGTASFLIVAAAVVRLLRARQSGSEAAAPAEAPAPKWKLLPGGVLEIADGSGWYIDLDDTGRFRLWSPEHRLQSRHTQLEQALGMGSRMAVDRARLAPATQGDSDVINMTPWRGRHPWHRGYSSGRNSDDGSAA